MRIDGASEGSDLSGRPGGSGAVFFFTLCISNTRVVPGNLSVNTKRERTRKEQSIKLITTEDIINHPTAAAVVVNK